MIHISIIGTDAKQFRFNMTDEEKVKNILYSLLKSQTVFTLDLSEATKQEKAVWGRLHVSCWIIYALYAGMTITLEDCGETISACGDSLKAHARLSELTQKHGLGPCFRITDRTETGIVLKSAPTIVWSLQSKT